MSADDTSPDLRLPGPTTERAITLLQTCEAELENKPEPAHAARLHYQIALLYEGALSDLGKARSHFNKSLKLAPDRLSSVIGARRVCLAKADYRGALPLFDTEVDLVPDGKRKALLLYEKGCLLENHFHDMRRAREAYAAALEFDRNDVTVLKALERCDLVVGDQAGLRETYELLPNAVSADSAHRAALLARRVRYLAEDDQGKAADLYESALRLAPTTPGVREALKRIYHDSARWLELINALIAEANDTTDEGVRAAALYYLGRTQDQGLGQRGEAIDALAIAADIQQTDYLIVEDLANLYEANKQWRELAILLRRLVSMATQKRDKAALLHRLGQLLEQQENEGEAIKCFTEALTLEPTFRPCLQALGKLHTQAQDWGALIHMHLAEAEGSLDPLRRATSHARVAEIYEIQMKRPADAARQHERALELVPGHPASFKALTRLYEQAQLYRELIELHERALDGAPSNVHRIAHLFKIGLVWENSLNEPGQAIHCYQRILNLDLDHLGAIHALQRSSEAAGEWQELVSALELEAGKTKDREQTVALLHRAGTVLDEQLDDSEGARSRFHKLLEVDPTFVPALASLGRIYYRAGRWNDLMMMYQRELEVTPDGEDAVALLYRMGELCEQHLGKPKQAIDYMRRAAEMDPSHQPSLRALKRNLELLKDWAGLAKVLDIEFSAVATANGRAACKYRIAQVYESRLDDDAKAIAAYSQTLEQVAGYRPAIDALVRLHSRRGEWRPLVDVLALDEQTSEDPLRVASALLRQAEVWRDHLNDAASAVGCLEQLLDISPGHLEALLSLEELHLKSANRDALEQIYVRQAEVLKDPAARVAALREVARLQETAEAMDVDALVETYKSVLAIEPDDHHALSALQRLFLGAGDHAAVAVVSGALSEAAADDEVASYYLTVQAQALETEDSVRALKTYVAAVRRDRRNLTAIRGASRLAEEAGDRVVLVDALRAEANVTNRNEVAAELLVRSAILYIDLSHKTAAVDDLRRALELWPDSAAAADSVNELLLEAGRVEELIDILSRAAGSAKQPARLAALWQTVAELYAYRLDNLGAGISTLTKALKADPSNAGMMGALADLYAYSRQWAECAELLERMRSFTKEPAASVEVLLVLATVYDEHLAEPQKAIDRVNEVLGQDEEHVGALTRLADVYLRQGDLDAARTAIKRLIKASAEQETLVAAFVKLATVEAEHGSVDAALAALSDAIALDGPNSDAAEQFKTLVRGPQDWNWFARALGEHIKRTDDNPLALGATYLELATVQAEQLATVDAAIKTLEEGIAATGGDSALVLELATRLRWANRPKDALKQLRGLLAERPTRSETWRALVLTLEKCNKEDEARLAMAPLEVLGTATDEEREAISTRSGGYTNARPGAFSTSALKAIAVDNSLSIAALSLMQALCQAMPKLVPDGIEELGLSRRDRIPPKSANSIRVLADELAPIFGVEEFDMYEHAASRPLVVVEASTVPAIIVSEAIVDLSQSQQVFLLSHSLCMLSGGFYPIEKLSAKEVAKLLTAAGRTMVSGFGAGEDVDDYAAQIRKAIPRKSRKDFENTARFYVSQPCPNVKAWVTALKKTALRAALLLADDLPGAVQLMHKTSNLPKGLSGEELVDKSPLIAAMVQFWVSPEAIEFRRTSGLLSRRRGDF